MKGYWRKKPAYWVELAREARRDMTVTECLLWEELRKRRRDGLRFRDQHPSGVTASTATATLVVEVDGQAHEKTKENDRVCDQWMHAQGIEVLRIAANEVRTDMPSVHKNIKGVAMARRFVRAKHKPPKVPPSGI